MDDSNEKIIEFGLQRVIALFADILLSLLCEAVMGNIFVAFLCKR